MRDPQSWNKYAYVRNNPLKYFDPTGEKATIEIQTDEEHKRATIKIKASIALWTGKDSKLSTGDLQKAAASYKKQIEQGWNGQFQKNGITVTIETTVDVKVYDSQSDANGAGAQNVIEVMNGPVSDRADSETGRDGLFSSSDTGRWNKDSPFAAHEFGHFLGIDYRTSGSELMNQNNFNPVQKAIAADYKWGFNAAINSHRRESQVPNPVSLGIRNRAPTANGFGPPRSYNSTRELRFPYMQWWLR